MRTVDYSEILHGSASLAGMRPADIAPEDFTLFRTFHDRRLQAAWEIHRWPDICRVEKRFYRQAWDGDTAYVASDERYHIGSDAYYQALQPSTGETPSTGGVVNAAYWALCAATYSTVDWVDGLDCTLGLQVKDTLTGFQYQCFDPHTASGSIDLTKFGRLTPFAKYIAYEQTGETAIGEYLQATNVDPRISTRGRVYEGWLGAEGMYFNQTAPNYLWLYFRERRPVLLGDAWDAEAVYASGQVYFAAVEGGPGNFYTPNPDDPPSPGESPVSASAKWVLVDLPYFLRGYLISAGYADWLTGDGQAGKAAAHESNATAYLELEADKLQRQQHQVARFQTC